MSLFFRRMMMNMSIFFFRRRTGVCCEANGRYGPWSVYYLHPSTENDRQTRVYTVHSQLPISVFFSRVRILSKKSTTYDGGMYDVDGSSSPSSRGHHLDGKFRSGFNRSGMRARFIPSCAYLRARTCVRACARARVCTCVCACVCVRACVHV